MNIVLLDIHLIEVDIKMCNKTIVLDHDSNCYEYLCSQIFIFFYSELVFINF